jgi:divinyl chlorophyllide a 8-vinyl-reductase
MSAASAMSARASVAPRAAQLRARSTARVAARRAVTPRASIADLPKENKDTKVLVVGGTGYIGKFVVRELCAQGYDVTALVREKSGIGGKTGADEAKALFPDATVTFGSVAIAIPSAPL